MPKPCAARPAGRPTTTHSTDRVHRRIRLVSGVPRGRWWKRLANGSIGLNSCQTMSDNASVVFRTAFGVAPRVVASAPGRVNLIGEHTDYNGGPVLPVATAARTSVAVGPGDEGVLELISTLDGERRRIDWRDGRPAGWGAYLAGVMSELDAAGAAPPGAGARVAVARGGPLGAGRPPPAAPTVPAAEGVRPVAAGRLRPP